MSSSVINGELKREIVDNLIRCAATISQFPDMRRCRVQHPYDILGGTDDNRFVAKDPIHRVGVVCWAAKIWTVHGRKFIIRRD